MVLFLRDFCMEGLSIICLSVLLYEMSALDMFCGGDPWDSSDAEDSYDPNEPHYHNAAWGRFAAERSWGPACPSHLERHCIEILNAMHI